MNSRQTVSDTMCENLVQLQWINNCLTAPTMAETVTRPSLSSFSAGRGNSSKCFSRVMKDADLNQVFCSKCLHKRSASLASETYSPIYLVKCETLHLEFPICLHSFSSPLHRVWLHAGKQSKWMQSCQETELFTVQQKLQMPTNFIRNDNKKSWNNEMELLKCFSFLVLL